MPSLRNLANPWSGKHTGSVFGIPVAVTVRTDQGYGWSRA